MYLTVICVEHSIVNISARNSTSSSRNIASWRTAIRLFVHFLHLSFSIISSGLLFSWGRTSRKCIECTARDSYEQSKLTCRICGQSMSRDSFRKKVNWDAPECASCLRDLSEVFANLFAYVSSGRPYLEAAGWTLLRAARTRRQGKESLCTVAERERRGGRHGFPWISYLM